MIVRDVGIGLVSWICVVKLVEKRVGGKKEEKRGEGGRGNCC